jgi:hypothetical protein
MADRTLMDTNRGDSVGVQSCLFAVGERAKESSTMNGRQWTQIKRIRFVSIRGCLPVRGNQTRVNNLRTNRSISRSATSIRARNGALRHPQQPQPERSFDEYSAKSTPGLLVTRNPTGESGAISHSSQSDRESSYDALLFLSSKKGPLFLPDRRQNPLARLDTESYIHTSALSRRRRSVSQR